MKIKRNINQKSAGPIQKRKYFLWVILAVLISGQVFLTIQTSTKGASLLELEKKSAELIKEQEMLKNNLVNSSSVSMLHGKATELGFVELNETMYVKVGESYAVKTF